MSGMVAIKKVSMNERHLQPGRTNHTFTDKNGSREFPPFKSLVITHSPDQAEFILWRFCKNGMKAHTHHDSLEDATHQAEWEFEVMPEEWADTNEAF
jgi:hypothetical protein